MEETCGRLIDLDHAKMSRIFEVPADVSADFDDDEVVDLVVMLLKGGCKTVVDRKVASFALKRIKNSLWASGYIRDTINAIISDHPEGHIYTCEDLFWNLEVRSYHLKPFQSILTVDLGTTSAYVRGP